MDEIGRGTSTFDGVSIAWSVAEYMVKQIGCNTLFATHYHVLTNLDKHDGVKNFNISVKEKKDDIIFLRKLLKGGTDKSYGIHVAKIAGMPSQVIDKAKEVQFRLYEDDDMKKKVVVEKKKSKHKIELKKVKQTNLLNL